MRGRKRTPIPPPHKNKKQDYCKGEGWFGNFVKRRLWLMSEKRHLLFVHKSVCSAAVVQVGGIFFVASIGGLLGPGWRAAALTWSRGLRSYHPISRTRRYARSATGDRVAWRLTSFSAVPVSCVEVRTRALSYRRYGSFGTLACCCSWRPPPPACGVLESIFLVRIRTYK